jgi:XTP/dITP diphosphohydrolase
MNKSIHYVTGNADKFRDAQIVLPKYGYDVIQNTFEMKEEQSDDGEHIARDKAQQAFFRLKEPLFVNDTVWMVPALNNFPGAFMHYVNKCFLPEDWLRLMHGIDDRRAIMREYMVYKDEHREEVFFKDMVGEFLHEASGTDGENSDKVVSFTGDGVSIASARDKGVYATASKQGATSYDLLGEWLKNNLG